MTTDEMIETFTDNSINAEYVVGVFAEWLASKAMELDAAGGREDARDSVSDLAAELRKTAHELQKRLGI